MKKKWEYQQDIAIIVILEDVQLVLLHKIQNLRKRLNPDEAALRVYNYLHAMTLEAQLLARACGKTNIHSLEPEDMAALTMEASALAKVPLSGTNHTVGVDDFHKI